jgi:hypothetical protein
MTYQWPFFDSLWSFFCQLLENLSQNGGQDSHFETLRPNPCSPFYEDIKSDIRFDNRFDIRLWNSFHVKLYHKSYIW